MDYDFTFRVVLCGDICSHHSPGVGKSSVLRRLVERKFQAGYAQTVGVEFASYLMELGHAAVNLQLWDTAGQERFNSVTSSYFRGAAGVLIVFDISK